MRKYARLLLAAALVSLNLAALPQAASARQTITVSTTDSIIQGHDKAIVTADHSSYNPDTARYTLRGNVMIQFGSRTFRTDTAKISTKTLQFWTENNTQLMEGDLHFTGGAVYADLQANVAWFFGPNCSLERPGLAIHSDNMVYNWCTRIASFDGHVLCIQKGEQRTAGHMEYDLDTGKIR